MKIEASSPDDYLARLSDDRREAIGRLRDTINRNLPGGFQETMSYGMISWVVPHSVYPAGYHCNPKEPLPFISVASQKNHVAIYHMGMYAVAPLLEWFSAEYKLVSTRKIDIGKSCIRFKKADEIPLELIARLVSKMTVREWIEVYEKALLRS